MVSASVVSGKCEYRSDEIGDHPIIVIRISDESIPPQDVKAVMEGLEYQIRQGEEFKPGESLQLGFILNQFSQLDDGRLILQEPDMKSIPVSFVSTMNYTFKTLRVQKEVVESIGKNTPLDYPSVQQAIAVHKDYAQSKSVMLERIAADDEQSGWWLHRQGGSKTEDYQLISLFQFAVERPDLVKFLALPQGSKTHIIENAPIRIFNNNEEIQIRERSFLADFNRKILSGD